jgi:transposase InsO family protein
VGSTGDSYDNALAESVIGLFKTEEIYRRGPWKGLEDVEFATLEMGRLVQPPSPARAARLCAAGGV